MLRLQPAQVAALIAECTSRDPAARPAFTEVERRLAALDPSLITSPAFEPADAAGAVGLPVPPRRRSSAACSRHSRNQVCSRVLAPAQSPAGGAPCQAAHKRQHSLSTMSGVASSNPPTLSYHFVVPTQSAMKKSEYQLNIHVNPIRERCTMCAKIRLLSNPSEHTQVTPDPMLYSAKETRALLLGLFPAHVAEALMRGERPPPERKADITMFFSDIVGFTTISSGSTPEKARALPRACCACCRCSIIPD